MTNNASKQETITHNRFVPMTLSQFRWLRSLICLTAELPVSRSLTLVVLLSHFALASNLALMGEETENRDISIAVLGFDDQGPSVKLAPLRNALAEMLSGDLSQYEGLRATERLRISQFLDENDLRELSLVEQSARSDTGKALAADYLLSGRYSATPEQISLQAMLYRVGGDKPRATWEFKTTPDKFLDVERQLLAKILEALELRPVRRPPPQARKGPAPTLAVLALKNLGVTTRLQAMETGFAELLQSNLSALGDIRLVEREKLYRILEEQKLNVDGLTNPEAAIRIGRLLGAERFLFGSFLEIGGELRIDLRLVDSKSAEILRTESASGPTERFAELLEDLALRVAADLAVQPPENAARLVQAASPTRKLEAAIHFTTANQKFYRGQFKQAAASYERTLLVEPNNVHAAWGRLNCWLLAGEYPQAAAAGEQTLNLKFLPEQSSLKEKVYDRLCSAYYKTREFAKLDRTYRRLMREFPDTRYGAVLRVERALFLMEIGRREEAAASLEAAVKDKRAGEDALLYASALRTLHSYYFWEPLYLERSRQFQNRKSDPEYMRTISLHTKHSAKRAVELLQQIIAEVDPDLDINARLWAQTWLIEGLKVAWIDEQGKRRYFLSDQQRFRLLTKYLDQLPSKPRLLYDAHEELAGLSEKLHKWHQAIESYQYLLDHPDPHSPEALPVWEDVKHIHGNGVIRKIDALFKIATIYHEHLQQPQLAIQKFQQLVADFGVTHHRGVAVVQSLHQLGASFQFPQKSALIWGGGADALTAWRDVLEPRGYTCHRVGQYQISRAHLAPYDLVVLVRTGMLPYEPTDILALQSYVATGGSLLVVVSPGWEPAAVGIHNSLLSPFGIRADEESVTRAVSTKVKPHPITRGIRRVMAKNAVHLSVPEESALIQSGDKTVLAAMPYRMGRIVVCSFGQWFQPEFERHALTKSNVHWRTSNLPLAQLPVEFGRGLQMPLLRNVVAWLDQPHGKGTKSSNQQMLESALRTSLLVQFQVQPRDELAAAMDRLVASVSGGVWKEEALWIAGEACLQLYYFPAGVTNASYGRKGGEPSEAEPRFYQELLERFPDSALEPYAQWRLADCRRRVYLNSAASPSKMQSILDQYKQIDAPQGSTVWAWSRLRMASLLFRSGDYKSALGYYRDVSERMPHGPEKSIALLNLGVSQKALGEVAEARATFQQAKSAPDIFWWTTSSYANWTPMDEDGNRIISTTHKIAEKQLEELPGSVRKRRDD
jgi:tetratricopeptide (TPR) repeat protein